jgi:hypothetical protein
LTRSAVLIVTNEQDVGADFVVRELDERGIGVVRLNTEHGTSWRLTLEPGQNWRIRNADRELNSADCVGVWATSPWPGTGQPRVTCNPFSVGCTLSGRSEAPK